MINRVETNIYLIPVCNKHKKKLSIRKNLYSGLYNEYFCKICEKEQNNVKRKWLY